MPAGVCACRTAGVAWSQGRRALFLSPLGGPSDAAARPAHRPQSPPCPRCAPRAARCAVSEVRAVGRARGAGERHRGAKAAVSAAVSRACRHPGPLP